MRLVLASQLNASVYAHWLIVRGEHSMPRRQDIDPTNIKRELPYVYIAQVMRDEAGMWFRFRLMGSKLVENLKQDGTGRVLLDLQIGGWEVEWRKNLVYATQMKMPVVDESTIHTESGLTLEIEHLALPLSEDDLVVDKIFGAIDFYNTTPSQLSRALPALDWQAISSVELAKRIIISNLSIHL